ncbi:MULTISPECIES: cobalt-precorrin-6A reductase [unclassified Rhizobium]|uniref:cobalt-precorrin-6A reductase n=1 Tax=unclassified Rhizobium TaxID=2613769 RepID=UPI001A99611E|nr:MULTISPECIES: cobalt-precorrin-6A reductase [unclassified Rhizobium]MBX5167258.1 cobalt-precorrin-6A reductase [Rhizobium sp. NZLR4b]MBX5169666.1 cobalt-precorrin-6A reductase [Rhizobium sp. NZLR1b]MBX5186561.1 cobalt-precorrin-6A reductase [Rhizobium sp. NZLR5]MBX5191213.1 cobalt-precorrin-6A reductase [Rhizobium sp. NZLR3b]MBX5199015.1 cobalt-precorrin-6A reductase [Rhizobium sp. NZLR10]
MGRPRILILGGTSEARLLAGSLAARGNCDVLLSLAGRTEKPAAQPVPVRIGGFGGAAALADFLKAGGYDLLIDATHPFAERISANAAFAAETSGITTIALRRPEWQRQPGDRWREVQSIPAAIEALGPSPRHVFLATGRQGAHHAEAAAQHFYLIRSVDPVERPLALANVDYLLDRGPFTLEGESALLKQHHIDAIIAKNSGGAATYAKIEAARLLGIEVMMVARASASTVKTVDTVEAALATIDHLVPPAIKRGV